MFRLNVVLPAIAAVLAVAVLSTADRTDWHGGYGFDGTVYGSVAEDLRGSVSGAAVVRPPNAPPNERGVLDSYYAKRIFPSAVVYTIRRGLGIAPSAHNIVLIFAFLTVAAVALVAWLWCRSADLLGLTAEQKLLGWMALILNFAALKASAYWPVTTDMFAYAEGAALLYFWARRSPLGVAAATVAGAFTWPTLVWVGMALLAFPRDGRVIARRPWRSWKRLDTSTIVLSAVTAATVVLLAVSWRGAVIDGGTFGAPPLSDISSLGAAQFPLGMAIVGAAVFWALVWLLPSLRDIDARAAVQPLRGRRGLLALGVLVFVLGLQQVISRQPGLLSETDLLKEGLPWSGAFPGLFLISLIGYYGPLLALAAWSWPSICRALHREGIGISLVAAAFLATALLVESRKVLPLYPLLVPFCVIALGDLRDRRWFLAAFAGISLVTSRFWLHIGHFPLDITTLREFPAEKFFMTTGIWMTEQMYLVHLAAILVVSVVLLALLRPRAAALSRTSEA